VRIYREVDLVVAGDNREMHRGLVGWVSLPDLERAGSVSWWVPRGWGRR
jgi:hypothetical protein